MRSMVLITLVCLSCTNPTPPNVDPDADADDMRVAVDLRKPAADLSSDLASDLADLHLSVAPGADVALFNGLLAAVR